MSTLLRLASRSVVNLYLFTKSDLKTTLLPITAFAAVAAPSTNFTNILHSMLWIWVHLLQFDVSNQYLSIDEDRLNKAYRPLPAGRITPAHAYILRWALVPICFGMSWCYSMSCLWASVGLVSLTIIYDELGASAAHWSIRNVVNGLGFGSFEIGATLVAGHNRDLLDDAGCLAVILSVLIFATTIHTQDFKDQEGDAAVGRKTIPLTCGKTARPSVLVSMAIWSAILPAVWKLTEWEGIAFFGLGSFVGLRFLFRKGVGHDQVSFYWYNVWLTCAHSLPGIWRAR